MLLTANILTSGLWPALSLLLVAIAPLILFTAAVHFLERVISYRLATRFGWRSVMLTGWLGTPVHELSHALFCVIFRHEIRDMALFEPDLESGRLGYVHHSYQPGNWYQEIGNVFIAIAPLVGGTVAIIALLMTFYPDVGRASLFAATGDAPFWSQVTDSLTQLITGILNWRNLASWKFWLFIYLVICIGNHMAPSPADYRGGLKGAVFLLVLLLVAALVVALVDPGTGTIQSWLSPVLVPVITVLILVLAVVGIATVVVWAVTEVVDQFARRRFAGQKPLN